MRLRSNKEYRIANMKSDIDDILPDDYPYSDHSSDFTVTVSGLRVPYSRATSTSATSTAQKSSLLTTDSSSTYKKDNSRKEQSRKQSSQCLVSVLLIFIFMQIVVMTLVIVQLDQVNSLSNMTLVMNIKLGNKTLSRRIMPHDFMA